MDMEKANPIVHDAVGSKRDASLFDVVPSKAVAAAGGGRIPPGWDPYEPVPYISPPNPYDTFMDDPWNELSGSDVGSDDEHHDVKTRQVLRRLQNIGNTNPKVGASVNPHSFRAKHMALGMHLRSIQRVEISAGRMPPLKPKAPKGSNKWRQMGSNDAPTAPTSTTKESSSSDDFNPALPRRNEEAAPTIDTTVAILMEKNEELSLECDRLRDDLAAKKKNSKTLVELICSLRNERDMLKNKLIKQKERNIASAEKASSILKTVCLDRDKSDIEYKILLQDKVQLQKLNLEYADIAILALLERQKAQDKLMHLMLESCSEREETLKEVSSLVGYMSDVGRTSQNPPRLSSNSSGTSFQQCMLGAPTTSTH
ncbi:hypothetical protein QYE76_033249 [Lolium multiflorum]|uniref:Uncharacterized protein n=1 Tax=Lolium multiflorum TaxID=4521 RepID=A0AAD8VLD3_LOLMU|nr:hypothetical protein QYE76_033249 [Lolium multiflorum]